MQQVYQKPFTSTLPTNRNISPNKTVPTGDFHNLLKQQVNHLKVSKHANVRLEERNIHIDSTTWERIGNKLSEAKQKGIKDSLVLVGDAALVVSTVNNTVITAMDRNEVSDHIFTNINGAIVMN
ncbi:TIGR02530 family flagellar biosynthesis protein [Pseudalkalibacillus sp. SCS-8]|uniref:TIGR02530 family flagellar biosynthesis protein n=1 Tax=Pseudalkalibacillus nanhaiensis TaxID=3115291 RepID=UPI0032DA3C3F